MGRMGRVGLDYLRLCRCNRHIILFSLVHCCWLCRTNACTVLYALAGRGLGFWLKPEPIVRKRVPSGACARCRCCILASPCCLQSRTRSPSWNHHSVPWVLGLPAYNSGILVRTIGHRLKGCARRHCLEGVRRLMGMTSGWKRYGGNPCD